MSNKKIFKLFIVVLAMNIPFLGGAQAPLPSISEDFKRKGFHVDLRIQVMTPQALRNFADELAEFGMNTLVVEWEGTYPFKEHPVISNEFSYSREEVIDFISYCESLGIEIIPLQQSLGHVEYILRNPRYSVLKEDRKDISQLCPMETVEARKLYTDLFSDMAEVHNSDYIHIGGDETYLLGHCEKCSKKVAEQGKSKLFVDHMKMITEIVIDLGKKPVMWADIILKYPEAAGELPEETIFVDWNYGWKVNHFGDVSALQKEGFTFWGAPSIRSHPDNWYMTNWTTHFRNQKDFVPYAREAGYEGMIMTSWSTSGVYGFTWDVGDHVIDMEQIRNTYPMAGFRILIAAFAQALDQEEPLDPEAFVVNYAQHRFGLTKEEGKKLWQFLSVRPELIQNGKPARSESISEIRNSYGEAREMLYKLKPKTNLEEFAHFKLMADLRMHYLKFKEVEAEYNSKDYEREDSQELLTKLDEIFEEAGELNERFAELHQDFLYDAEIKDQNEIRIQPVEVLYSRLSKLKGVK
ncbi:family 20 glycosylhydrolase [Autumnicola musiva]|uniref:Family 20 glycosylhydrolase n=1 Tax=Autumnicola musiva TaxID=3075589 RepID=A0ABU3D6N4_9FLAO|nr:family 20 glycosylhydrolase [Zunongwangia sp. F117]MDT0677190.1 family 20 glycosylhydrolase [Zunongwangia sp. F117]